MTIRTVNLDGVQEVDFDPQGTHPTFYLEEKYLWIKNNGSQGDIYVSAEQSCTVDADGTARIRAREASLIELTHTNKIYLRGSGTAEIITNDVPVCPC